MHAFFRRCLTPLLTLLVSSVAAAQTGADPPREARAKEELRALGDALNAAWNARDRAALERIYAPEFVFVHGFGYVDDRSTHIEEGLELRARVGDQRQTGISLDPPNQLLLLGDVAVLRRHFRNPAGNPQWGTTIYARRDGRWQIVQLQGTELNPEHTAVPIDPAALGAYVGRYDRGGGAHSEVARVGDGLVVRHPTLPTRKLTPVGDDRFFDKGGNELVFQRGADGRVTELVIRTRDGRELRGRRLP